MFMRFFTHVEANQPIFALGSDSLLPVDGRWSTATCIARALEQAQSLRAVGKRYIGFAFVDDRLNPTSLRPVVFTEEELGSFAPDCRECDDAPHYEHSRA